MNNGIYTHDVGLTPLIRRFRVLEGFLRFASILTPLGLRSMSFPYVRTTFAKSLTSYPALCAGDALGASAVPGMDSRGDTPPA